jgi:hypothetical protein
VAGCGSGRVTRALAAAYLAEMLVDVKVLDDVCFADYV